MATEVDVVVVGGGPSGAATAHYLASRGHSVLVCEKKTFPREKTCGDGLTPRAVKVLNEMGLGSEIKSWERVAGPARPRGRPRRWSSRSPNSPSGTTTDW